MALFKPTVMRDRLADIDVDTLKKLGVKGLVLDVDNTLSRHFDQTPFEGIDAFLKEMRGSGIKLIILSNSPKSRVEPFAKKLDLDFEYKAKKPLTGGLKKALRKMELSENEVMLCGDQLFTDMLCGNFSGVKTLLVSPVHLERGAGFKIKRFLEKPFLSRYRKNKGDKIL